MNAPLSAGLSAGLSATTLTWAAVIAALAAAGLARWLTLILITRATRLGLDDVPNHRSSHRRITPRGGGLAVVAATVIVLGAVAAAGLAAAPGPGWGLALLGCLGLAVVGLIDDMRSLGQRLRLVCQAVAVALILHAGLLETSARGIALPADTLDAVLHLAATMPGQMSSTAQDLARGKRSEIDHLNGYIVRRGEALGIATPVNRLLHTLVRLLERHLPAQADGAA